MNTLFLFHSILQNYFGIEFEQASIEDTSPLCRKQYESLDSSTLMQMFDASAKSMDGLLSVNLYHLGNFEQCYKIAAETDEGMTYGKYCMGKISGTIAEKFLKKFGLPELMHLYHKANETMAGIYVGVCVPDKCTPSDIEKLTGCLQISEKLCYSQNKEPDLTPGAYITIIILGVSLAIVFAASVYEALQTKYNWKPRKVILAFSAVTNSRKLFSASTHSHYLLCLNGIKAISMLWVLLGHGYGFATMGPFGNFIRVKELQDRIHNMVLVNSLLSVDTFLAVSGLVTVSAFLTVMEKTNMKFNIPLYYLHRYIRLTPLVAILVLIGANLLPYLGRGPFWYSSDNPCKEEWWRVLLYIQNYFPSEEHLCMPHTWYLCLDFQLFLISPVILILLQHRPKIGDKVLGILLILGCLIPFTVAYVNEYSLYPSIPYITHMIRKNVDLMKTAKHYAFSYFMATHSRFGPYIIGMIFGYAIYLARKHQNKIVLSSTSVFLIWTFCITGLLGCIYGPHFTFHFYDRLIYALLVGFLRNIWAMFVCITIFMCVIGYGGLINQFLSLPVFQFLSKISFSMYLIHVGVFTSRVRKMTSVVPLSHDILWFYLFGNTVMSLILSIVFTLTFEAPAIQLENILFSKINEEKVQEKKID